MYISGSNGPFLLHHLLASELLHRPPLWNDRKALPRILNTICNIPHCFIQQFSILRSLECLEDTSVNFQHSFPPESKKSFNSSPHIPYRPQQISSPVVFIRKYVLAFEPQTQMYPKSIIWNNNNELFSLQLAAPHAAQLYIYIIDCSRYIQFYCRTSENMLKTYF